MANRDYRHVFLPATTRVVGPASLRHCRLRALATLVGGALTVLVALPGCVHQGDEEAEVYDPTPPAPAEVTVSRDVAIGDDDDEDTAASAPPAPPAMSFVWSKVPIEIDRPRLFRLGAGLGALGHIDLNPCRDHGLTAGYVHMNLTFQASGRVVRAAVETSMAPPPEALSCIGEQVEATRVPQFEGGDVNLSRNFFVN
jgi:hypothetical protein